MTEKEEKYLVPAKDEVIKNRKIGRVKGKLERNQRLAFTAFIKIAYEDLLKSPIEDQFSISTKDLCSLLGVNYRNIFNDTKNQKSLKTLLSLLQGKVLLWEYKDEKGKAYMVESNVMLAGFTMTHEKTEFAFSPFVRDKILTSSNAYILKLPVLVSFRSTYSIAVYEQIVQRKEFGIWHVKLEDFRELVGISPNQYKKFERFRISVLNKAINELNNRLHLNLSVAKVISENDTRKVIGLTFTWDKDAVDKDNHSQVPLQDQEAYQEEFKPAKEALDFVQVSMKEAECTLQPKGSELNSHIKEVIDLFPEYLHELAEVLLKDWLRQFKFDDVKDALIVASKSKHEVKNWYGYVRTILQGLPTSLIEFRTKQQEKALKKQEEAQDKKQQEDLREKKLKREAWWNKQCTQEKITMSSEELEKLKEEVDNSIREKHLPKSALFKDIETNIVLRKYLERRGVKPPEDLA